MSNYITQKEIAAMLEVSPATVRRNHLRWGLVRLRGFRSVRFARKRTVAQLVRLGMLFY